MEEDKPTKTNQIDIKEHLESCINELENLVKYRILQGNFDKIELSSLSTTIGMLVEIKDGMYQSEKARLHRSCFSSNPDLTKTISECSQNNLIKLILPNSIEQFMTGVGESIWVYISQETLDKLNKKKEETKGLFIARLANKPFSPSWRHLDLEDPIIFTTIRGGEMYVAMLNQKQGSEDWV